MSFDPIALNRWHLKNYIFEHLGVFKSRLQLSSQNYSDPCFGVNLSLRSLHFGEEGELFELK